MHDLMHDLANSVSGNDCSILQESSPSHESSQGSIDASSLQHEVRHLSLDYVSNNAIAAIKEVLAPQPRTILVFHEKYGTENHLSMAISKFISLRALKTCLFETHITNLKHLRLLDCSYSNISALPEATSMFYSLQTLILNGCWKLSKLPNGMRYMSSLRHIFLVGCYNLKLMPQDIGQLDSLQTLTSYVIDSDVGRGIDQLKDLNLGGALSLSELKKVHSAENAKQGNMCAKHNLKRLSLNWENELSYNRHVGYEVHTNAEDTLEALRPNKRLEVLLLFNYTGAEFSSWMHGSTLLEHLTELSLTGCKNFKDLPPLWQLPSLGYLSLNDLHSLTSICVGINYTDNGQSCMAPPPFFPKLEMMLVSDMPKLERWHLEVAGQVADVSFPQLKELGLFECPMLASMLKMLPLLKDLHVKEARDIPFYHLTNLSLQSDLECKGSIKVKPTVGWRSKDLHFSRLGDSYMKLKLNGLTENAECFEEELNRIPCGSIKKLNMTDCDCLFSSKQSQIQLNIWNHFCFVEKLSISGNNNIVQWPAVELGNLNHLRRLDLFGCSDLTSSLPSTIADDENALPPRLQKHEIAACENLVEIPKLPASLEKLSIRHCPKLVSMPTILGNVKKLRQLDLIDCDSLTTFQDGMYGVTALKDLWMVACPRVETLPEGLVQQLPALETYQRLPQLGGGLLRRGRLI